MSYGQGNGEKAVIRVSCFVFRENLWWGVWFAPEEMSDGQGNGEKAVFRVSCFVIRVLVARMDFVSARGGNAG